jgi:hypothetical protein
MPIVTGTFTPVPAPVPGSPAPTGTQPPAAVVAQLHDELGKVGLPVTGSEVGETLQFDPATAA